MAKRNKNQIKAAMNNRAFWLTPAGKRANKKRQRTMIAFWRSPKGKQVIEAKAAKLRQLYAEDKVNNPFRRLTDQAIAYYLSQDPEMQEFILENNPELIELKRAELLLKRSLKDTQSHESTSH